MKVTEVMKSLEIIWVAVGVTLTTATQLRAASVPVGPGEAMLAVWFLIVCFRLSIGINNFAGTMTKTVSWFWFISLTALAIGLFIAELTGMASDYSDLLHDAIAFIFAFIFSIAISVFIKSNNSLYKVLITLVSFTAISLFLIFLFPALSPFFNPWYGEIRFVGWSHNPNQLALLLSAVPFFCLHLMENTKNLIKKILYVLAVVCFIILGMATQSDALIFAWGAGGLAVVFLLPYKFKSKQRNQDSIATIFLLAIALFLMFVCFVFWHELSEKFRPIFQNIYDNNSQGSERLILWKNGIIAVAYSPLFGLGPGSHSGMAGPLLNFEAHNTLIDWAASSGIIGVLNYVFFLGWVGWNAWRKEEFVLVAALIALAGFSCFHYVLRHVIFWFYILAIAGLSTQKVRKYYTPSRDRSADKRYPSKLLQP